PVRIRRHRQNTALSEQAAAVAIRQCNAPERRAMHVGNSIKSRKPLVDEGEIGVEQIYDAAVLTQHRVQEQLGFMLEALPQTIVEFGKRIRIRRDLIKIAQVEPLPGEIVDQGL